MGSWASIRNAIATAIKGFRASVLIGGLVFEMKSGGFVPPLFFGCLLRSEGPTIVKEAADLLRRLEKAISSP